MATAPRSVASTVDKLPKKLPIGVLAALTITTSLFIIYVLVISSFANLVIL
jgi:hypothetical protein